MSLVKKQWLDGIFDEFPFFIKDNLEKSVDIAEIIPSARVDVAIAVSVHTPRKLKTVLCYDFLYCNDTRCVLRHWYRSGYECRMRRRMNGIDKNYEREALNRALVRMKRTGFAAITVEKIEAK